VGEFLFFPSRDVDGWFERRKGLADTGKGLPCRLKKDGGTGGKWRLPFADMRILFQCLNGGGARNTINVLDVPMTRKSSNPITFTSTQSPDRFHFSMLQFDNLGYMTLFGAKDTTIGLNLHPENLFIVNNTIDGLDYYINVMGRAVPEGTYPEPTQPISLPGIMNLLLLEQE